MKQRFRDGGSPSWMWAHEVWVRCPSCAGPALVALHPEEQAGRFSTNDIAKRHRLTCTRCTLARDWQRPRDPSQRWGYADGRAVDPWFHLPVWLFAMLPDGPLWAYNRRHLLQIRRYIGAELRERRPFGACVPQSMVEQLPGWMKSARNRAKVVAALDELERRLPDAAVAG
jgi:hypothetical protein